MCPGSSQDTAGEGAECVAGSKRPWSRRAQTPGSRVEKLLPEASTISAASKPQRVNKTRTGNWPVFSNKEISGERDENSNGTGWGDNSTFKVSGKTGGNVTSE